MRKLYLYFTLLALLILGGVYLANHLFQSGPREGDLAPNFSLKNFQDQSIQLSDYRGKVVLVNIWASFCGPCRQEMPSLNSLYRRYQNKGFVVLGVSEDDHWEDVQEFLKQVPVDFPILRDADYAVANAYHTYNIPESFLIDKNGYLVEKIFGAHDWDSQGFWDKVDRLLQNK